jgi:hypothetical protein
LRFAGPPSLMMSGFINAKFRAFRTEAVSAYSADSMAKVAD